jgi:hypothetical protein
MSNTEWKQFVKGKYLDLKEHDLGLETHQYVRFDFAEPSFLVYRKSTSSA